MGVALVNAAVQLGEPLIDAGQAALNGDIKGAASAFRAGAKSTLSGKNMAEAGTPIVIVTLAKKFLPGIARKKIGGRPLA